jgi:hypothetical protein
MEVAHDLHELKELVEKLGLRDNRREHPRYKVDISGTFSVGWKRQVEILDTCQMVDVSRKGLAIKTKFLRFKEGMILRLQFSKDVHAIEVLGKAVHISKENGEYLIGVESLNKRIDIINQLFSQQLEVEAPLVDRRKHHRYQIPAAVTCKFFEETLQGNGEFQGFIQDISLGGVSLEIRDDFLKLTESMLRHTTIEMTVEFNFPDGITKMDFSGIIKWDKRIKKDNKSYLYLGIQFHSLDARSKETIKKFLTFGEGDKNLIWELWDNNLVQS